MDKEVNIQELKIELQKKDEKILELERKIEELNSKKENFKKKAHSYKELIHSSPSLITLLMGKDLIIEIANDPVLNFWKKDRSIIGKPLMLAHPDIREQGLEQMLHKVLETGVAEYGYEMPVYITRGNKKELTYFNFVYQPQKNIKGEIAGVAVIAQEVTPKAVYHQKIQESEYKYRELIHSSNSLIAILRGEDMVVEIANDAIKAVWGKGMDVEGKPLFEILPEMIGQGMPQLFKNVYKTGEPYFAQERPLMHVQNGEMKLGYFDFVYQPQTNIHGEIDGVAVIAHDVTKQGSLNKKLRENEKQLRDLVNFMPHKISMTNAEGVPFFYNESWVHFTGKSMKELLSDSWHYLVHPEDLEITNTTFQKCIETGEDMEIELRLFDKNGEAKWHLGRAIAIRDEDDVITSWISSVTEIQKLKEDEKRKEDFLKLVSHELKTPVTSIKGYVQLLLAMLQENKNDIDRKVPVKAYLNRMETQVERLIRLLSEMLDLSRIEQNELELKKERFNLNRHIEDTIEDLFYSNKNIQIQLDHKDECEVFADKDRIGQVIINFVTNALKFSPDSNRVEIAIYKNKNNQAAVGVRDFGIGIQNDEIDNIFKRFYRVSGKRDDTYDGFGIGLYLSHEIIERHNGEILVESEPGEGSKFTFTIPLNHN